MKLLHITPRRWGKTTSCISEFIKYCDSGEFGLLIFPTYQVKKIYLNKIPLQLKDFVVSLETYNGFGLGISVNKLFLDEFDMIYQKNLRTLINDLDFPDIEGWTTANKIYDRNLFEAAKENKKSKTFLNRYQYDYFVKNKKLDEYIYLYDSILTDTDSKIIQHDYTNRHLALEMINEARQMLDEETFCCEFEGQFLTI